MSDLYRCQQFLDQLGFELIVDRQSDPASRRLVKKVVYVTLFLKHISRESSFRWVLNKTFPVILRSTGCCRAGAGPTGAAILCLRRKSKGSIDRKI